MKFKDLLNLSFKKFIRKKSNILCIFMLFITSLLIMFSFSFQSSLDIYWKEAVEELVDYRTYYVNYDYDKMTEDEALSEIKKLKHIEAVAPNSSHLISLVTSEYVNNKVSGDFYLIGTIDDPVQVIKGRTFNEKSVENKEIICPKQFLPDVSSYSEEYEVNSVIDLESEVGKQIELSFVGNKEQKDKYTLIGVYDSELYKTNGNKCYAPFELVRQQNLKYQPEAFASNNSTFYPIIVVVDDIDNINSVETELEKNNFSLSYPTQQINAYVGNKVINLSMLLSCLLVIFSFMIIILLLSRNINNDREQIGILKASGFSDNQISLMYVLELIYCFVISIIMGVIFLKFIVVPYFMKYYISKKVAYYGFVFLIDDISLLLCMIVFIIIIAVVVIIVRKKILKVNTVEILKD